MYLLYVLFSSRHCTWSPWSSSWSASSPLTPCQHPPLRPPPQPLLSCKKRVWGWPLKKRRGVIKPPVGATGRAALVWWSAAPKCEVRTVRVSVNGTETCRNVMYISVFSDLKYEHKWQRRVKISLETKAAVIFQSLMWCVHQTFYCLEVFFFKWILFYFINWVLQDKIKASVQRRRQKRSQSVSTGWTTQSLWSCVKKPTVILPASCWYRIKGNRAAWLWSFALQWIGDEGLERNADCINMSAISFLSIILTYLPSLIYDSDLASSSTISSRYEPRPLLSNTSVL